ncbi:hypothetical protein OKW37_000049 [Paraburkholderia sp. MM5482-R2]
MTGFAPGRFADAAGASVVVQPGQGAGFQTSQYPSASFSFLVFPSRLSTASRFMERFVDVGNTNVDGLGLPG